MWIPDVCLQLHFNFYIKHIKKPLVNKLFFKVHIFKNLCIFVELGGKAKGLYNALGLWLKVYWGFFQTQNHSNFLISYFIIDQLP